jgi:hypothetical protein
MRSISGAKPPRPSLLVPANATRHRSATLRLRPFDCLDCTFRRCTLGKVRKEIPINRVRFVSPNAQHVYLHDTPSKNLFGADDRTFSSGPVRVEDPMALAERLLAGQAGWSRKEINQVVEAGKTRTVSLDRRVPVLLTYWTAWADRDGELQLRRDVYGRDAKVLGALESEFCFTAPRRSGAPRTR